MKGFILSKYRKRCVSGSFYGRLANKYVLKGTIVLVRGLFLNGFYHLYAFNNVAEYRVCAIQMWGAAIEKIVVPHLAINFYSFLFKCSALLAKTARSPRAAIHDIEL